MASSATKLRMIKALHTAAWAFFAAAILLIPVAAWHGAWRANLILIGIVSLECLVLAANGMRCPLTPIAARYTQDRADNFDIYLPLWVARYNKAIFGTLFLVAIVFSVVRWLHLEFA